MSKHKLEIPKHLLGIIKESWVSQNNTVSDHWHEDIVNSGFLKEVKGPMTQSESLRAYKLECIKDDSGEVCEYDYKRGYLDGRENLLLEQQSGITNTDIREAADKCIEDMIKEPMTFEQWFKTRNIADSHIRAHSITWDAGRANLLLEQEPKIFRPKGLSTDEIKEPMTCVKAWVQLRGKGAYSPSSDFKDGWRAGRENLLLEQENE